MVHVTLPPGIYYIGDLGYVTKGEAGYQWIEKVWQAFYADKTPAKLLTIDQVLLFLGRTQGGDGIFDGFYCDTGTLVVLAIDTLLEDERFYFNNMVMKGAKFVTFLEPFQVSYQDGQWNIADRIHIHTV